MVSSKYTQLFKSVFQQKKKFVFYIIYLMKTGKKFMPQSLSNLNDWMWHKKLVWFDGCPRTSCEASEMIFNQFTLLLASLYRGLWSVLFISIYWLFVLNREWTKNQSIKADTLYTGRTHTQNVSNEKIVII